MIKEAIEYLASLIDAASTNKPITLNETPYRRVVAWNREMKVYDADPPQQAHTIFDIPSMASFINAYRAGNTKASPRVFVGHSSVNAILNYGDNRPDSALMALNSSVQYNALFLLCNKKEGFEPKDIVDILDQKLKSCFDDQLRAYLAGISVSIQKNAKVQLDAMGMTSRESKRVASIIIGDSPISIPMDWTFDVSVWDCWPETCAFPVRLSFDIEKDDLVIRLSFIDHTAIMLAHRQRFIDQLRSAFGADAAVYSGTY